MEPNEKRNLNCLALKGMFGSAEWKVVLLMFIDVSLTLCFVQGVGEHRNALGWMVKLGWTQSLENLGKGA